jgi:serine/threonine protein kinase
MGMARSLTDMDMLSTVCGSPGYMAPEIISRKPYDEKVRARHLLHRLSPCCAVCVYGFDGMGTGPGREMDHNRIETNARADITFVVLTLLTLLTRYRWIFGRSGRSCSASSAATSKRS